ncbi:hypothetical protein JZ751_000974 [Albula glossodonta]|uniref:Uncharacterized protein n=1 Tax=Albula glossodonta TaxID=121402 RepID=A0A8T2PXR6_9TELE|nr:hypothetical protein JZ751_000974 [Albula glossodonta]
MLTLQSLFILEKPKWRVPNSAPSQINLTDKKQMARRMEDNDADEDGNQCPLAEPHRQEDGLGAAGQEAAVAVARAHLHGQRSGAAQDRVADVLDHHRQQEVNKDRAGSQGPAAGARDGVSDGEPGDAPPDPVSEDSVMTDLP